MLPADVNRDVVPSQPGARGVTDLTVLAGGVADDLGQELVVVSVVVHLAEVRREDAGGLVADLARQPSLPRVARTSVENLVRQVASRDPVPVHERAAKHI